MKTTTIVKRALGIAIIYLFLSGLCFLLCWGGLHGLDRTIWYKIGISQLLMLGFVGVFGLVFSIIHLVMWCFD